MRQRITFIQHPEDSVDPDTLKITGDSISTTNVKAAREDRITFGFDELPQELYRVLKASHELHIRWVSEKAYDSISPMVSRLSPGLHVFYTPQMNTNNSSLLCPSMKKVFGEIDCISPEKSFTNLPNDRFSQSAATQYYTPLSSLAELKSYIDHKLCHNSDPTCLSRSSLLNSASSVDIDFDTISHALTITAFWPSQSWDLSLSTTQKQRLEVGILSVAPPTEPEELSLGGFLTVIGENTKPSPTLFSFPARHHPISESFTSKYFLPTGLHPNLELSISSNAPPFPEDERDCSLHAHLTLPKHVFPDKYQLDDSLFLASKNLSKVRYISSPIDLEAPSYTIPTWGSTLLLSLSPPPTSSKPTGFTSQIPLHLRYLPPSSSPLTEIEIPYPVVFWACTAEEGSKFPINPFDRTNLGYDGLFGPRTIFYHLNPKAGGKDVEGGGELMNGIQVPVLDLGGTSWVEVGTAGVVVLGFVWVLWCLGRVWWGEGYGGGSVKGKDVAGEKKKL